MHTVCALAVASATSLLIAGPAAPAAAHDHRAFARSRQVDAQARPMGRIAPTLPSARLRAVAFDPPRAGAPRRATFATTLTRNPETAQLLRDERGARTGPERLGDIPDR